MFRFYTVLISILISSIFVFAQEKDFPPKYSASLQIVNDSTYFFSNDTIHELWFMDKTAESWNLGKKPKYATFYNNSFRLLVPKGTNTRFMGSLDQFRQRIGNQLILLFLGKITIN